MVHGEVRLRGRGGRAGKHQCLQLWDPVDCGQHSACDRQCGAIDLLIFLLLCLCTSVGASSYAVGCRSVF